MIHINLANDDQQALLNNSLDTLPFSETEKLSNITGSVSSIRSLEQEDNRIVKNR